MLGVNTLLKSRSYQEQTMKNEKWRTNME